MYLDVESMSWGRTGPHGPTTSFSYETRLDLVVISLQALGPEP
jgi:hypothetical protein